jgi:hypothetical protein
MITIRRNENFKEWLNISLVGKVIDNARTMARALEIAKSLQKKEKQIGNNTPIKIIK